MGLFGKSDFETLVSEVAEQASMMGPDDTEATVRVGEWAVEIYWSPRKIGLRAMNVKKLLREALTSDYPWGRYRTQNGSIDFQLIRRPAQEELT